MRCLANLLDRWVNRIAPLPDNVLADIEADVDCLGPDELWAAHQRFPAADGGDDTGTTPSPVRPAGAQRVGGLFSFVRRRG